MSTVRAACHVHSEWSYDGTWTLAELAEEFAARNYQVLMVTEHDRGFDEAHRQKHREACRQASNEKILVVPGIEYSDPTNTIHLLTWGDVPFTGADAPSDTTLDAVKAAGGITVFAHPSRRNAWKLFKPEWTDKLLGIELWNRKTDGWAPSQEARVLLERTRLAPFVGMDFHTAKQQFPLATIVTVDGPVTEISVLAALKAGKFYSEALGRPVDTLGDGARLRALRTAEFMRRRAAAVYRRAFA